MLHPAALATAPVALVGSCGLLLIAVGRLKKHPVPGRPT